MSPRVVVQLSQVASYLVDHAINETVAGASTACTARRGGSCIEIAPIPAGGLVSAVMMGVGTRGGMSGRIWVEPGHGWGDEMMRKRRRGMLRCFEDFGEHSRY